MAAIKTMALLALWLAFASSALAATPDAVEPIHPLPAKVAVDPAAARLGAQLFADKRLSADGSVSCLSCHPFNHGGADPRPHSIGTGGKPGGVNAPSIFNLEFQSMYNWTGAAADLGSHLDLPMKNPAVMGNDLPAVAQRLQPDAKYQAAFRAVFPDGLTVENLRRALVEYERSLVTPHCRFDKWLLGKESAITNEELEGYRLFKSLGCTSCHQGVNVGGNLFQKFGVMGDYFTDRGDIAKADYGRYNITGEERDRFVFRVPSLRNVALTAPYFHDGSAKTLSNAVRVMAQYQLGRTVSDEDVSKIVAFLGTLTGEIPMQPTEQADLARR